MAAAASQEPNTEQMSGETYYAGDAMDQEIRQVFHDYEANLNQTDSGSQTLNLSICLIVATSMIVQALGCL